MSSPYPGYPPNYTSVPKMGGYFRDCLVIELLCPEKLSKLQLTLIQERLEAALANMNINAIVEKSEVVTSDRFDPILKQGLRLP